MQKTSSALSRVLASLAVLLICKVTLSVVIGYRHYLPPNFDSDFLQGRQAYFWGAYSGAFYMHLVAYNLIRQLMAVAAQEAGVEPWTISFKGTLQTIVHLLPLLNTPLPTADWCQALLTAIATHNVGNRPDRFEPRVRKRRPKKYKLMREPRESYRRRMAA